MPALHVCQAQARPRAAPPARATRASRAPTARRAWRARRASTRRKREAMFARRAQRPQARPRAGIHDLRSGHRIQVKQAMPLQWCNVGCTAPPEGTEMHNPYLLSALQHKTSLTQAEWDRCGIDTLRLDHFVYDGSKYLQPVAQCTWMRPTTPSMERVAKQQSLVNEALTTLRNGIILHFAQTQSAHMFADSWYAIE